MTKIINHWGVYVDKDIPVTGVLNSNQIAWEFVDNEICLDCEAAIKNHGDSDHYNPDCEYCREIGDYCLDWLECEGHTFIIGDWILDTKTGEYSPDPNGEYSAIVNNDVYTVQVILSKTIANCNLCSPCYPGQGDVGSQGDFKAYTLPDYLTGE